MHLFPSDMILFRWQDAVDILLNSYILFRLYVLFRGTRIFQAILSIVLFWILQHIAAFYGMIITGRVLGGFMAIAVFIIIVVFKDEAYGILQAKTLKTLLWSVPQPQVRTPVEIIIDSVLEMAGRRIGALWVFPGKKSLEGIVRGGISWQGLISREMLLSIFWNHNPVHDGAAIIENDRVTRVGVILPLSQKEDLPSHYGTRHRAALGLSEITEALTLVVSEERGVVTAAKNGELVTVSNAAQLQGILEGHLGLQMQPSKKETVSNLRMTAAAILSFLAVIAVWFGFTTGLETLATLEIPIEYASRDPSLEIQYTSASNVQVQVGGSGPIIRALKPEQIKVKVDLGGADVGSNSYPISVENIDLPWGVELKKVDPGEISIQLDRPVIRDLPVQIDWAGRLDEQLIVSDAVPFPDRIEVKGGSHAFSGLGTLYTEKINLDALKTSGEITAEVLLPPGISGTQGPERPRVSIHMTIEPRKPAGKGASS